MRACGELSERKGGRLISHHGALMRPSTPWCFTCWHSHLESQNILLANAEKKQVMNALSRQQEHSKKELNRKSITRETMAARRTEMCCIATCNLQIACHRDPRDQVTRSNPLHGQRNRNCIANSIVGQLCHNTEVAIQRITARLLTQT